jgi:hypothetical protein
MEDRKVNIDGFVYVAQWRTTAAIDKALATPLSRISYSQNKRPTGYTVRFRSKLRRIYIDYSGQVTRQYILVNDIRHEVTDA